MEHVTFKIILASASIVGTASTYSGKSSCFLIIWPSMSTSCTLCYLAVDDSSRLLPVPIWWFLRHPRNPQCLPRSFHFKSIYPHFINFLDGPPFIAISCDWTYQCLQKSYLVVTGKPWLFHSFLKVPMIPLPLFSLALISFVYSSSLVMNVSTCSSCSPWTFHSHHLCLDINQQSKYLANLIKAIN